MATPVKTAAGTWRIQIEVRGLRDAGTFPTRREAVEWAATRKAELLAGGKPSSKTLKDALRKYAEEVSPHKRGWRKEMIRLQAFERQLPIAKKLCDLTPGDLAIWRDGRLKVNARGSVLRDMTLLSSVLEVARREWGWLTINPMKDVRRPANPDHRERLITGREIRLMLRTLGTGRTMSASVGLAFLLALRTGMRAGEICALTWDDVHEDWCRVRTSKTGKGRDVPLSRQAKRTIERARGPDDVSVFNLKSQTLDTLFRRARDKAGLSGFTFHDSRHVAATMLAQKVHALDLCRMFGWTNPKMAMRYYNLSASAIAKKLG